MQPSIYTTHKHDSGVLSITQFPPQLSMTSVSTAAMLALGGLLWYACVIPQGLQGRRQREAAMDLWSGEAHAPTRLRQARVLSIVSSVHSLL